MAQWFLFMFCERLYRMVSQFLKLSAPFNEKYLSQHWGVYHIRFLFLDTTKKLYTKKVKIPFLHSRTVLKLHITLGLESHRKLTCKWILFQSYSWFHFTILHDKSFASRQTRDQFPLRESKWKIAGWRYDVIGCSTQHCRFDTSRQLITNPNWWT